MALVGDVSTSPTPTPCSLPVYDRGDQITAPVKVVDLPGGTLNHHWTKNIIASPDGTKLYAAVGSNSNVAEHGMRRKRGARRSGRSTCATGTHRVFASGLRNPVGMAWEPELRRRCGWR